MTFSKIERNEMIKKAHQLKIGSSNAFQHDFLAMTTHDGYYESEKYFFAAVNVYGYKELRFFKGSKRVSLSNKFTNQDHAKKFSN